MDRYFSAQAHNQTMQRYSSAIGAVFPSQSQGTASLSLLNNAAGTWTNLGPGNIGGRTRAILIDPASPNTMYAAGQSGGVWKSTDAGASWIPVGDILPNLSINSMAMDPGNLSTIYAGTGEGTFPYDWMRGAGIYKTTDGANTWTPLAYTTTNPDFYYVNKLVVSPRSSSRVYAATSSGIWRSLDGGATWAKVLDSVSNNGCFDLATRTDQSTDYIFASCGTFSQAKIYRNTDAAGSGTWSVVYTESRMGLTSLAIAPSNQSIIYALSASTETGNFNEGLLAVFRSTSNGDPNSWTAQVRNTSSTKLNTLLLTNPSGASSSTCNSQQDSYSNQGWYDNIIAVDPVNPNTVWVGGIDLFRSDDAGANWGLASYWWASGIASSYAHADQHAIVFHPQYNGTTNQTMFAGNDGGLFKTTNAKAAVATSVTAPCNASNSAVTWTTLNHNIGITQFYNGAVYPDGNTFFGGTQDNGTVRGTVSGGPNAWTSIQGGDGGYVALNPANTNQLYAEYYGLSIQRSLNGGTSWSDGTTGITNDSGFLFIAPFTMDPNNAQNLWTGGSYIWRTTNGASSWVRASASLGSNVSISALGVAQGDSNSVVVGTSDGQIFVNHGALSANSATTWSSSQPQPGWVSWVTFDPNNHNTIYAVYSSFKGSPTDAHVYQSLDSGNTWTGIDGSGTTGIPDIPVHAILVDPSNSQRIFLGTDLGVYSSTDGGATWNVEITGFTTAVTDTLKLNTVSGTTSLYAFTHGRGVWKAPILASTGCSYTVSAPQPFGNTGGAGTVNVTTSNACQWTATSNVNWISVTGANSGTGNGSFNFTVGANSGAARTGTITVGSGGVTTLFTVNEAGASGGSNDEISGATLISALPFTTTENTPFATSNPTDPVHSCTSGSDSKTVWFRYVAGFTGVVSVNTLGSSYDTVLAVYPGTTSAGAELACNDDSNGTLQSSVTLNVTSGQSYLIEISGFGSSNPGGTLSLSVSQSGTCAVSISPGSSSFGSTGGTGSITITASGCAWTAVPNVSWISILSGSNGTGNGTVQYTVAANQSGSTRTGSISIGAQTFTVTQSGSCTYSLSATGKTFLSAGGSGSVAVNTSGNCVWTVSNSASWIMVTSTTPVTGDGSISYTVAANNSTSVRSTTLSVAGLSYIVIQAGTGGFPLNDEVSTATLIPLLPYAVTENTTAATSNVNDPVHSCTFVKNNNTVWFQFVPNFTGIARVDTFGSSYDTVLAAYSSAALAANEVACNDDANGTLQSQVTFFVNSGQTYYIEAAAFGSSAGTLTLHASNVGNDDPSAATQMGSLPFITTQATQSATFSLSDPSHSCTGASDNASVWFQYTATFTGTLNVNTLGSDYDTVLTAYPGSTVPGIELACSDDTLGTLQSQLSFQVTSGQSYLIEVTAWGANNGGNLVLNAVQLSNDLVSGAIPIPAISYSETQDIQTASGSGSDPVHSCTGTPDVQTVWFRYVAGFTGRVQFDTLGSDYDTVLSAYAGNPTSGSEIACNDDDPISGTLQSRIAINVVSGNTYYIEASSFDSVASASSLLLNATSTSARTVSGDFDGNGIPDTVLQFPDGSMGVWYLTGAGRQLGISGFAFMAGPSTGIKLVDVADLNGDGVPDLILRFNDGSMGVWYMGGQQGHAINGFAFISGPIQGWIPVGLADLNNDGHPDLVIQYTDGTTGVWYLGGALGNQIQGFAFISGPTNGWNVAGLADLDNDGHPDVILQYSNGMVGVWHMGGSQGNVIQDFALLAGPSTWSVVGTTDMDADGHPDLMIRNIDGTLGVWYLGGQQGNQITGFTPLTIPGSTNWRELAVH